MRRQLWVAVLLGVSIGVITVTGLSGGWPLVERASWVVIILGLPLAVLQLRLLQSDQTRIAKELSRKPSLRTGFGLTKDRNDVIREIQIVPAWTPNAAASVAMQIELATKNFGTRTAQGVLMNLIIPESLAGVNIALKIQRHGDPERFPYIIRPEFNLNPGDVMTWSIEMAIPKGILALEVVVSTSMLDTAEVLEPLQIQVRGT